MQDQQPGHDALGEECAGTFASLIVRPRAKKRRCRRKDWLMRGVGEINAFIAEKNDSLKGSMGGTNGLP